MEPDGSEQESLLPPREPIDAAPEVLDLFTGIGGMALGFRSEGFAVRGVDIDPVAGHVFQLNGVGDFAEEDLATAPRVIGSPVVTGGPPCRPWSAVNMQRRGRDHNDHLLLNRFFQHLIALKPQLFIIENVPPLLGDHDFQQLVREMERRGYSIKPRVLRYSDFGAATARRRLFTVGLRDSVRASAAEFFARLDRERKPPRTVRQEIEWLRDTPHGSVEDHHWSQLRSIENYAAKYETGEFGWRKLNWDEPAPSFGSIAKTYILHPDAGVDGYPLRVLSVREVLCIMGFDRDFRFPPGTSLTRRYHMVANTVSPHMAAACARVAKQMLWLTE
jgi:DNA (cytosine-5)-methyltransferase 1